MSINIKDGVATVTVNTFEAQFHVLWLRDNCLCDRCIHKTSHQKINATSLDLNTTATQAEVVTEDGSAVLRITWNDGHQSRFDAQWLQQHAYHAGSFTKNSNPLAPVLWSQNEAPKTFAYSAFIGDDATLREATKTFIKYGLITIKDVPLEKDAIESVALRVGPIKDTFFGRTWDVKSVPQASNIAYTSYNLPLHQDLPYFLDVPAVQMLHCLKQTPKGGDSVFSDSFKAASILKERDPQAFEVLTKVRPTFQYTNSKHNFSVRKPVIQVLGDGPNEVEISYSPHNHGPLDASFDLVVPFYKAFALFSRILENETSVTQRMTPGDLIIFDNKRTLHARTEFDPSSGERHLRGTYMEMDSWIDKFHVLS